MVACRSLSIHVHGVAEGSYGGSGVSGPEPSKSALLRVRYNHSPREDSMGNRGSTISDSVVALFVVLFWGLDGYFLCQGRRFRSLV